jgi:hypothetical protein
MFQDIAPLVALKMAQIGCAAKATRLLTLHTHTAARFLQTAWRRHRFEKKFAASTPPDVCLRQRAVFAVCISEIKKSLFPKDPSKVGWLLVLITIDPLGLDSTIILTYTYIYVEMDGTIYIPNRTIRISEVRV